MSETGDPPGRDDPAGPPERPTLSRGRGRALIVGTIVGAAVLVIAFMLLVSQCGAGDDGDEITGSPAAQVESALDLR